MKMILSSVLVFILLASGCIGIIAHGSSQDITINSTPSGATVKIDGANVGVTPIITNQPRSDSHLVEISMTGYENATFQLTRSADGGIIVADILLTGGIGLLIDLATGAMYSLSPSMISAQLAESVSINGNCITIALTASE